jgi:hypothetical protein
MMATCAGEVEAAAATAFASVSASWTVSGFIFQLPAIIGRRAIIQSEDVEDEVERCTKSDPRRAGAGVIKAATIGAAIASNISLPNTQLPILLACFLCAV